MTTYRIRDWDSNFENNRTRILEKLSWIPVPNKHDGEGFLRIMTEPDGLKIYGAWHLILQVASKCRIRGTLMRDDGTPHTPESIALKAGRIRAKDVKRALEFCSTVVDWVESLEDDQKPQQNATYGTQVPDGGTQVPDERHRREGKEGKGKNRKKGERVESPSHANQLTQEEFLGIAKKPDVGVDQWMAEQCWDYYQARGWIDKNGNRMDKASESLKSLLRNWKKNQKRFADGKSSEPRPPRKKTFEDHVSDISHRLWDQRGNPAEYDRILKSIPADLPKRGNTTVIEEALAIIDNKRSMEKVGK